jgi:hypothetical protein
MGKTQRLERYAAPHERGTDIVDTLHQDNLVSHASQIYSLTKAFQDSRDVF